MKSTANSTSAFRHATRAASAPVSRRAPGVSTAAGSRPPARTTRAQARVGRRRHDGGGGRRAWPAVTVRCVAAASGRVRRVASDRRPPRAIAGATLRAVRRRDRAPRRIGVGTGAHQESPRRPWSARAAPRAGRARDPRRRRSDRRASAPAPGRRTGPNARGRSRSSGAAARRADRVLQLGVDRGVERPLALEHLVEHDRHGPEVGRVVDVAAIEPFGRGVRHAAVEVSSLGAGLAQRLGDAEVEHLDAAAGVEPDRSAA